MSLATTEKIQYGTKHDETRNRNEEDFPPKPTLRTKNDTNCTLNKPITTDTRVASEAAENPALWSNFRREPSYG